MANETARDDEMKNVWQSQEGEGLRMSLDEIRLKAEKQGRSIEWRNAREYIAAFAVVVFLGFSFFGTTDVLSRVGFGLVIASMLYIAWHLHRKGSRRRLPSDLGVADCLQFYRGELERQRDLLQGVWRWYLGPVVPGLAVVMLALTRTNPGHLNHIVWVIAAYGAAIALVFLGVWRLNERAARRLQGRIDALDALRG